MTFVIDALTGILTSVGKALGYTPVNQAGDTMTGALRIKSTNVGGVIFDHYADVNNGTTVETDLYSDTIAANTFANNGDKIIASYGGVFTSAASATEDIRVYFAGISIFDTGGLTISSTGDWWLEAMVIRTSTTTARIMVKLNTAGASLSVYTNEQDLIGLTFSNANVLKITGQAGGIGGGSNQITAKLGTVSFMPAA